MDAPNAPSGANLHSLRQRDAAFTANSVSMTEEISRLMAAGILLSRQFHAHLPLVSAIPFTHLGHQLLADYSRVCLIVWGVTFQIRDRIRAAKQEVTWNRWLVAAAIFLVLLLIFAIADLWIVGIVLGLLGGGMGHQIEDKYACIAAREQLLIDLSKIYAQSLRDLIYETKLQCVEDAKKGMGAMELVAYGDAQVSEGRIPILIATNNTDPFPGYGWLLQSKIFTCRPPKGKRNAIKRGDLDNAIDARLKQLCSTQGLLMTFGYLVVVHGSSLTQNSRWLDESKRPWCNLPKLDGSSVDRNILNRVETADLSASSRLYSVVQLVFRQYLTCVTFFVRSFMVGDSVAFELSVSTLGPPKTTWLSVKRQLDHYAMVIDSARESPDRVESEFARLLELEFVDPATWRGDDLFTRLGVLRGIAASQRQYSNEWPGKYISLPNWREAHSEPMTNDFFGRTECNAAIRVIYDKICRGILDLFKELGFDVSDYVSETGQLINVFGSIEQMVNVGTLSGSIDMATGNKNIKADSRGRSSNETNQNQAAA